MIPFNYIFVTLTNQKLITIVLDHVARQTFFLKGWHDKLKWVVVPLNTNFIFLITENYITLPSNEISTLN